MIHPWLHTRTNYWTYTSPHSRQPLAQLLELHLGPQQDHPLEHSLWSPQMDLPQDLLQQQELQ